MLKKEIGENAGTIWQLLEKELDMSVNKLQKQLGINKMNFYLALGWLSRENKICFFEKNKELYICLME